MPGPLPCGDFAPGAVEGQGGGAEVVDRPSPLGLDQPHQMQKILRRVRCAGGQAALSPRPARPADRRARHHLWRGPALRGLARAARVVTGAIEYAPAATTGNIGIADAVWRAKPT